MALPARFAPLRERRPLFAAVAALVVASFLTYPAVDWWLRSAEIAPQFRFWDWGAYGGALERWNAGESLYVRNDDGGFHGSFLYPPITLLVFLPFEELLPYPMAPAVWGAVSVALLWLGLQSVASELGYPLRWWERGLLLWALLGYQPLLFTLKMGQTAGFLTALLCFAFVGLSRQRRGATGAGAVSGALTAAVGVFKLAYAPVGTHLFADRRRFAAAVATGVGLVALSLAIFGPEAHGGYLEVLRWGVESGGSARSPALWLPGYFRPLSWLPSPVLFRIAASAIVAVLALYTEAAERTVFALGLAAFPLLVPLAYTYYLVALLPAALVLLADEFDGGGRPIVLVVALALANAHAYGLKFVVDVVPSVVPAATALRPVYPLLQPGLWGALLLAGLAFLRVGEATPTPAFLAPSDGETPDDST